MHALILRPAEFSFFSLTERLAQISHPRFLGLSLSDPVPYQNTIWEFREALQKAEAFQSLFEVFNTHDSQAVLSLVQAGDRVVYSDSAYGAVWITEQLKDIGWTP